MKKISAVMSIVLALSLLPVASFANTYPQFTLATGTVQEYAITNNNQEVRFNIELGKDLDLNEGRVLFQINNAKLAKESNAVVASVYQGNTITNAPDVTVASTSSSTNLEGQTMFNVDINKKFASDHQNDLRVVISLKLDFTASTPGDVTLTVRDIGKNGVLTGIGNFEKSAAVAQKKVEEKDFDVRIQKADTKIGPAGGNLSPVLIYQLDKLSENANDNQVVLTLPKGYSFRPASTKVTLDSGTAKVTFNRDYTVMTITGVTSKNAFINIEPFASVKADNNATAESITANIDFIKNSKSVTSKDIKIGDLISHKLILDVKEKGQRDIPTLTKGASKTVELTLNAVEGTLVNGTAVSFDVDNAKIVYNSIKVEDQVASLTASRSAGSGNAAKVSGYEVYQNEEFSIRMLKSGVTSLKITFDVVADMSKKNPTITASSRNLEDVTAVIAKTQQALSVVTVPSRVEKGTKPALPDVVIKEEAVNTLQKGDKIYLEILYPGSDRDKGQSVAFETVKDIKVETSNRLEIDSVEFGATENILVLTVGSRSYSKAGEIKLKNLKGYLTEKAPENQVKLNVKLNANIEDEVPFFSVGKEVSVRTVFTINNKNYTVDGQVKTLVTAPYIKNGRTMLPVRAVGESLGLVASWDNTTKTATFKNAEKTAVVKMGESVMTVNNTPVKLSVPAEVKDGSLMIELRSLATAFGVDIAWNQQNKTVSVN